MGIRAATIVIVVLLVTAGAGAVVLLDLPWMESAQAVPDRKGDVAPTPPRSNFEVKGDRLAILPAAPEPVAPEALRPSLTLDTAKQFMVAPVVGGGGATDVRPASSKPTAAFLDDQQIAAIKTRLKLTSAQEKYWPPVEQALREVVTVAGRRSPSTLGSDHDSVKKLLAAAGPFLAQLRADQKGQIQSLMRIAGLGSQLPSN